MFCLHLLTISGLPASARHCWHCQNLRCAHVNQANMIIQHRLCTSRLGYRLSRQTHLGMLQEKLKKHICEPKDQQSSIVPPTDEDDTPQQAFLTEADLPFLTNQPPLSSLSPPSTSSSPPAAQPTLPSSLSLDPSTTAQIDEAASQPSVPQSTPSFLSTSDSPQQAQHEHAEAQQVLLQHAQTKVKAQAVAQETPPQPDWASTPTDAQPVSNLGSATAAGQAKAVDSRHPEDQSSSGALRPKDWHAAIVVPEGLVLQPKAGAIGAPLLQTPTQLPVFALDAVLWPNQIMMLRQVMLEPTKPTYSLCCLETYLFSLLP